MIILVIIGVCILLQMVLPPATTKNKVFIYSILISFAIALVYTFATDMRQSLSYTIGLAIGQGLVGGVIGYNLGILFFRKKFVEETE